MKYRLIALLFVTNLVYVACDKDGNGSSKYCQQLLSSLQSQNQSIIKNEIDLRSEQIGTIPTGATFVEIESMLKSLVQKLDNDGCNIDAELLCTMCIDTGIPISEIKITFPSNNSRIEYTIDLFTREGNSIEFVGIHEL